MIKILHIISDSNIGGAGRYLLTYLSECDREAFDVTVVVPVGSKLEEPVRELQSLVKRTDFYRGRTEIALSKTAAYDITLKAPREAADFTVSLIHRHSRYCSTVRIS